jgi:SRSO17 transposase
MPTLRAVRSWGKELDTVSERIGVRFGRRDLRVHAGRYLRGLISRVQRKNGWQLAEELGDSTPVNLQHFIARAEWSADSVRDDLQNYVAENLGQPDGVLIIDETGFLKKGIKSAGVKRQDSGTAGRIENCQIGVFLAYRSEKGHALIDRALSIPREWAEDAARRAEAKIPEDMSFATKPALARTMLLHALTAGVPAAWVTADEVYGSDYQFRRFCEERQLSYVVAISSAAHLYLNGHRQSVGKHLKDIPASAWRCLSCGTGSKGERQYDWAFLSWPHHEQETHKRGWLVRRSLGDQLEHAYYFTYAPEGTTVETLVRIAGSRWAIEECFEQAKQETGLDEYEVRSWIGWHRHITLSMLAHATLVILRERIRSAPSKKVSRSFRSRSRKFVV